MKPTQEHIDAINERLIMYEMSLESDMFLWQQKCNICDSADGCYDCLLNSTFSLCSSDIRNKLIDVADNNQPWREALETRYKELLNRLDCNKRLENLDI